MGAKQSMFVPAEPNRIRRLLVLLLLTTILLWGSSRGWSEDEGEGETGTEAAAHVEESELSVSGDRETREYVAYAEDRMAREQQALEALRGELMESVTRMERLSAQIDKKYAAEADFKQAKIEELAAIYANMKPAQIAERLFKLDAKVRYQVLSRLDTKKISRVLVELTPEQSALVSKKLLEVRDAGN